MRVECSALYGARTAGVGTAWRLPVGTESRKFRVLFGSTPAQGQAFAATATVHPPGAAQAVPR